LRIPSPARSLLDSIPGVRVPPPPGELPSASLLDNLRLNSLVIVPNAVQGLFRRRPRAVAAATRADVDRWAIGLLRGLRRARGPAPVWVRVLTDRALLVFEREDVQRVLEGSPHPFAADPEAKRKGMSAFQPDALTISRGDLWADRRRFTEAVLDTQKPLHRLADRFTLVAVEETEGLLEELGDAELDWEAWHRAFRRITRRVVLGDAARDDEELGDLLATLMDKGNGMPSEAPQELEPFMRRIEEYVRAAEEHALVGLFDDAPSGPETNPAGQVPHWLFAMGDTLAMNSLRALALLATHPLQRAEVEGELAVEAAGGAPRAGSEVARLDYLEACLQEAMRLWPTTALLSREALEDTAWDGARVPAGTQILISNTFNHRDPDRHEFAHRFAPEQWINGTAAEDWAFNHFSHGPQGCPGAGLALFLGKTAIATLLAERDVRLVSGSLEPERTLPHMLDFFTLRFRLESR
jgi:cytochrome P450